VRQVRVRGGNIKLRALRLDSGIFSWGSEGISRKARIHSVVYNGANNEFVRTNTLVKGGIIQVDAAPFRLWYDSYYGVTLGGKQKKVNLTKKERKAAIAGKTDKVKAEKSTTADKAKPAAATTATEAPAADKDAKAEGAKDAKEAAPAKDAAKKPKKEQVKEGKRTSKTALRKYKSRASKQVVDPLFEEQFSTGYILAAIASRPGQTGRIDGYLLEGKELEFYLKKTQKKKSQK